MLFKLMSVIAFTAMYLATSFLATLKYDSEAGLLVMLGYILGTWSALLIRDILHEWSEK